jgi:hypothetical protein
VTIPNVAHFVFGLREQSEPFHLVYYVCLESCRRVLAPDAIYLHYKYLPYGAYWDLIRPHLTLRQVELVPAVLAARYDDGLVPDAFRYAHHADFVRLDALIEHGGVYADIDTVFVQPIPAELFRAPFVIGREAPVQDERTGEVRPSLCNAVLMSEPGGEFARAWRQEMASALNGTWSNHSGFLAEQLSRRLPTQVRIEASRSFFPFTADRDGLRALLEECNVDTTGIYSVHLWSHLWWDDWRRDFSDVRASIIDEDYVRGTDTTYTLLARPFLPRLDLW